MQLNEDAVNTRAHHAEEPIIWFRKLNLAQLPYFRPHLAGPHHSFALQRLLSCRGCTHSAAGVPVWPVDLTVCPVGACPQVWGAPVEGSQVNSRVTMR